MKALSSTSRPFGAVEGKRKKGTTEVETKNSRQLKQMNLKANRNTKKTKKVSTKSSFDKLRTKLN